MDGCYRWPLWMLDAISKNPVECSSFRCTPSQVSGKAYSRKLAPKEAPAGVPVFRPYLEVTRGPTIEKSTFGETFQFYGGGIEKFQLQGGHLGKPYFEP